MDGTCASLSSDGTRLLCGKCSNAFSFIDVAAFHYGFDISNFSDSVKKICEIENISLDHSDSSSSISSNKNKSDNLQLQNLIAADVSNSRANIGKLPENEKRGLTDKTLEEFQIGVDFSWSPPSSRLSYDENKKVYISPRVIIPYLPNPKILNSQLTYYASLFLSERERLSNASKTPVKGLYGGSRSPFGLNTLKDDTTLIFVSEGEWDTMSIWQAINGKFPCLATGGTSDNGTSDALTFFFPNFKPTIFFVADNDDAGKKFADDFCSKLQLFGFYFIPFYFDNLESPKLDAALSGFLPGIYIVGGLTALGKTSFCLQLLNQVAKHGESCIFVSYEMRKGELFSKSVAREVFLLERKDIPRDFEHIEAAKKQIPRKIQLLCLKNRFGSNFDIGFLYHPSVDFFEPMLDEEYLTRTGNFTDFHINSSGQLVESNKVQHYDDI
jgi:hypothetical protein